MLRSDTSKRLWIQTETGEFEPVESHSQIHARKRGPGVPDWWVVAKDPGWRPASPGSRKGGSGCVSKPNFGGELQACTPDGRYTFDRGSGSGGRGQGGFGGLGGIVESNEDLDGWGDFIPPKRGRTSSRMGDLIRAEQRKGQGRGSVFARGAGLGKSLLADAGTVLQDGSEARPAPAGPALPPPPAQDKETRLIWSQSRGTLETVEGLFLDQSYSGAGGLDEKGTGRNNPAREGEKDIGPIPQGNWRIEKVADQKYRGRLTPPVFRLVPLDDGTRERVKAMGRDPDTFLIHGDKPGGNASTGCIILNKPMRDKLLQYNKTILRVRE